MATKYLEHFYSYKWLPQEARVATPGLAIATVDKEEREKGKKDAKVLIDEGNKLFNREKYDQALTNYKQARQLIFGLLSPNTPSIMRADFDINLAVDVFPHLLSGSLTAAKMNTTIDWFGQNIGTTIAPPDELRQAIVKYTGQNQTKGVFMAEAYQSIGEVYLLMGELDKAASSLEKAHTQTTNRTQAAEITMSLGNTKLLAGNLNQAKPLLEDAQKQFVRLKLTPLADMTNTNLGVLFYNEGVNTNNDALKTKGTALIAKARNNLPAAVREISRFRKGIPVMREAHISEFRIEKPEAELRARDAVPAESAVSAEAAAVHLEEIPVLFHSKSGHAYKFTKADIVQAKNDLQSTLILNTGTKNIVVDMMKSNVENTITTEIYQARITAKILNGLNIAAGSMDDFFISLPHLYYFTLPMAIGDCYFEKHDFENAITYYTIASNYKYLNKEIELPLVWTKLATSHVEWANTLYQQNRPGDAKPHYEKIVWLNNGQPTLPNGSPIYKSPLFDPMKVRVQAILDSDTPYDSQKFNPAVVEAVMLSVYNLKNIASGVDFPLMSTQREQVPVFRFDYLQNVARYFAENAIQAERTYINFKSTAETEEFQRSMLEDAMEMAYENEKLESQMVDVAFAQWDAMQSNYDYAGTRLDNARKAYNDYSNVSWDLVQLDAHIAEDQAINAGDVNVHSSWSSYGLDTGEQSVHNAVFQATQKRGQINRDYEMRNMNREIKNLEAAKTLAEKQRTVAIEQYEAAIQQQKMAAMRRQQAQDQLDLFNSQEFTPELWNRLSLYIKYISKAYLQRAITIAKMMEDVYEFELGQPVNIIKNTYSYNSLSGLLGGDYLLLDIDRFTYHSIIVGQKQDPVKEVVSLSERFPFTFLSQFRSTGRMPFNIDLFDLDRTFPGAYQRKIKRIEILVEGLIGPRGVRGTLTNSGISYSRHKDGRTQLRLLKPESLLLSEYRISGDSIVFTYDSKKLSHFELSPVATSWVLDIPPRANDLDYRFITDIKMVFYYESYYSDQLKSQVLEELADYLPSTYQISYSLKYEFTDEFIELQDTGEVVFTLKAGNFPFQHMDPHVKKLAVFFTLDDGSRPQNMTVIVTTIDDNNSATQSTAAQGYITTNGGAPLNTFIDKPLQQTWKIQIPKNLNQNLFNNGFAWRDISNMTVSAEYSFSQKISADEPRLLLDDQFTADPLANFDVINDSSATLNAPSNWTYVAAGKRVEQKSNIHGPQNNLNTLPNKPGTYLLRKTSAQLPAQKDFILKSTIISKDNDGIGFVFRYKNPSNFYFFLMDSERQYRRIGKKEADVFKELDVPAVDTLNGYTKNQSYQVKIIARGNTFRAYLDDVLILQGSDFSFEDAGRIGFYSWGNTSACFENMRIVTL